MSPPNTKIAELLLPDIQSDENSVQLEELHISNEITPVGSDSETSSCDTNSGSDIEQADPLSKSPIVVRSILKKASAMSMPTSEIKKSNSFEVKKGFATKFKYLFSNSSKKEETNSLLGFSGVKVKPKGVSYVDLDIMNPKPISTTLEFIVYSAESLTSNNESIAGSMGSSMSSLNEGEAEGNLGTRIIQATEKKSKFLSASIEGGKATKVKKIHPGTTTDDKQPPSIELTKPVSPIIQESVDNTQTDADAGKKTEESSRADKPRRKLKSPQKKPLEKRRSSTSVVKHTIDTSVITPPSTISEGKSLSPNIAQLPKSASMQINLAEHGQEVQPFLSPKPLRIKMVTNTEKGLSSENVKKGNSSISLQNEQSPNPSEHVLSQPGKSN